MPGYFLKFRLMQQKHEYLLLDLEKDHASREHYKPNLQVLLQVELAVESQDQRLDEKSEREDA